MHRASWIAWITTLSVLAGIVACVTVEETNRHQLMPVPEAYMDNLGVAAYAELKQKESVSHNAQQTQEVLAIAKRVAAATHKDMAWEFTLFNSAQVNAFCLPGGKVGVYTGIIPVAKTNAGLAAVLGHEMGHAIAHHGGERMTQQLLVQGTLMSIEALMGDTNTKRLTLAALGVGAQYGVMLPFSRLQESEADSLGILYMARAGFDPREAVQLWLRMARLGKEPMEFLSTHPDSAKRAAALEEQMPKAMQEYERSQKVPTVPLS